METAPCWSSFAAYKHRLKFNHGVQALFFEIPRAGLAEVACLHVDSMSFSRHSHSSRLARIATANYTLGLIRWHPCALPDNPPVPKLSEHSRCVSDNEGIRRSLVL